MWDPICSNIQYANYIRPVWIELSVIAVLSGLYYTNRIRSALSAEPFPLESLSARCSYRAPYSSQPPKIACAQYMRAKSYNWLETYLKVSIPSRLRTLDHFPLVPSCGRLEIQPNESKSYKEITTFMANEKRKISMANSWLICVRTLRQSIWSWAKLPKFNNNDCGINAGKMGGGKRAIDKLKINEHNGTRDTQRLETRTNDEQNGWNCICLRIHFVDIRGGRLFIVHGCEMCMNAFCLCRFPKSYYVYYIPIKYHKATDFHTN